MFSALLILCEPSKSNASNNPKDLQLSYTPLAVQAIALTTNCPKLDSITLYCDSIDADGHPFYVIRFRITELPFVLDTLRIASPDANFSIDEFANVSNNSFFITRMRVTGNSKWVKLVFNGTADSCICCIMIQIPDCTPPATKMKVEVKDVQCLGLDKYDHVRYQLKLGVTSYLTSTRALTITSPTGAVILSTDAPIEINRAVELIAIVTDSTEEDSIQLNASLAAESPDNGASTSIMVGVTPCQDMVNPAALAFAKRNHTEQEQDCNFALPVCQQAFNQATSYHGFGNTMEVPANTTCLGSGEIASVWYIFNTSTAGTFGFTLNTALDYDFALYDITGLTCADIPNIAPIRCNFSGTAGNTGLRCDQQQAGALSWNSGQPPMMPGLNVGANRTYVLLITNFNQNNNGYTLNFCGTATIVDNVPPRFVSTQHFSCADPVSLVTLTEPIRCNSIAANGSDFEVLGNPNITVVSATGVNCGRFTNQIRVRYKINGGVNCGALTLRIKQGTDGNTLLDNCGNAMAVGSFIAIRGTTPPATASFTIPQLEYCAGDPVIINPSGSTNEERYYLEIVETSGVEPTFKRWFTGEAPSSFDLRDLRKIIFNIKIPFVCGRTYRVKLAVQNCCTAWHETVKTIKMKDCPVVNAGPDTYICLNGPAAAVLGTPALPGYTYLWQPGNQTTAQITVAPTTTTTYKLTVTAPNGCSASDEVTVTVYAPLSATLSAETPNICTPKRKLSVGIVGIATTIVWRKNGQIISGQSGTTIEVEPSSTGDTYSVTVSNPCYSLSANITLQCHAAVRPGWNPDLVFPNAMIIGGVSGNFMITDIKNDPCQVNYDAKSYVFRVFDRWGGMIVELKGSTTTGFANQSIPNWNGRVTNRVCHPRRILGIKIGKWCWNQGDALPDGAYVWTIDFYGCNDNWVGAKNGTITILN